jgi:hypothetical protein
MREKPAQLVPLDAADATSGLREPLFGLDAESLSKLLVSAGEPAFRGRQLAEAMYRQWLREISEITTLPVPLRAKLAAEGWQIGRPAIARAFQSVDGTERYLVEFAAAAGPLGQTAEAVWMPEGDGGEAGEESEAEPHGGTHSAPEERSRIAQGEVRASGREPWGHGFRPGGPVEHYARIFESGRRVPASEPGRPRTSIQPSIQNDKDLVPRHHLHLLVRWVAPSTASSA